MYEAELFHIFAVSMLHIFFGVCDQAYCILNIIFLTSLSKFINHSGTINIIFGCNNGV